jgi:hypothetical protein
VAYAGLDRQGSRRDLDGRGLTKRVGIAQGLDGGRTGRQAEAAPRSAGRAEEDEQRSAEAAPSKCRPRGGGQIVEEAAERDSTDEREEHDGVKRTRAGPFYRV